MKFESKALVPVDENGDPCQRVDAFHFQGAEEYPEAQEFYVWGIYKRIGSEATHLFDVGLAEEAQALVEILNNIAL